MKKLLALVLLSVFLIVYCGAPEEGAKPEIKPAEKKGAEIAYEKLTETELQKFMKAFPVAKDEVEKSGKEFKGETENWEGWIGQFANLNKEIATLDVKLKAVGMSWDEFYSAFAKTWMAAVAFQLHEEMGEMEEGLKEIEAKLKDPKVSTQEKEMMKAAKQAMTQVKQIYDKVPQVNRDLVKKHWKELAKIMEIED